MNNDYQTAPIQSPPSSPIIRTNGEEECSSLSSSRFRFRSDTRAPLELTKLEQQTAQSITAFRTRLNETDKKIAKWNARFCNEVVDRDRDMAGMLDYVCVDPLERTSEKFFFRLNEELSELWGHQTQIIENDDDDDDDDGENSGKCEHEENADRHQVQTGEAGELEGQQEEDITLTATATECNSANTTLEEVGTSKDDSQTTRTNNGLPGNHPSLRSASNEANENDENGEDLKTTSRPSIQSLCNDISSLSSNLDKHIHISTPMALKEHIYNFQVQIQSQIPTHIQLEKLKASKREQSIHQKFESMAGLTSKSLEEEKAAAHADLTLLTQKVQEAGGWDELRTSRFLKEIAEIREMLRIEREERMKNDALVLNKIAETREMLHRTLLESVGSD